MDKEKQRAQTRARVKRYRDKAKSVTDVTVKPSVTKTKSTLDELIEIALHCECEHCKTNRVNGRKHVINHGPWKPACKLVENELNRVSLPGDADYGGVCEDMLDRYRIAGSHTLSNSQTHSEA